MFFQVFWMFWDVLGDFSSPFGPLGIESLGSKAWSSVLLGLAIAALSGKLVRAPGVVESADVEMVSVGGEDVEL